MKRLLPILLLLNGCANVSTSRFTYEEEGRRFSCEMPKEVDAKNLKVKISAKTGEVEISADNLRTRNTETIKAQGKREAGNLAATGKLAGKLSEGAAKGAVKALIPLP